VDVIRKDIKNVHLSVHPPAGRVRIAAPLRMNLEVIRIFAISKRAWIKRQQKRLLDQQRESPREYLERESHYVWGKRYLLRVLESTTPPGVELKHRQMLLRMRPGTSEDRRQAIVDEWYRTELKRAVAPIIAK
jgi:predicted metal-dependent hydrolase